MAVFRHLIRSVLDAVFPAACFGCGASGEYCCGACLASVDVAMKTSKITGRDILSAFPYAHPVVRTLIHDRKYRGMKSSASSQAVLMRRWALAFGGRIPECCVLVPVPLHPAKMARRGFNQSEELARMLGSLLDLPVETDLLFRVRHSPSQTDAADRHLNVESAFRARRGFDEGVFLIDDVVTSGATMEACMHALEALGTRCVGGFTFAWSLQKKKKSPPPRKASGGTPLFPT